MDDHAHHDHDHDHHDLAEPSDYVGWVMAQRRAKDEYLARSPSSPLPEAERAEFDGLPYYAVDPRLRFEFLGLGPLPEGLGQETHVQTSDGRVRHGTRAGTLTFAIEGAEQQLVALQLDGSEEGSLFVPFKDATNGPDTYGAGRYLDLAAQDDGTYDLDFNLAYSPFCAYSPAYSCPLPPPENWLTVAIRAGERVR
jgi:uncharacterized protein (DUF1684 family)